MNDVRANLLLSSLNNCAKFNNGVSKFLSFVTKKEGIISNENLLNMLLNMINTGEIYDLANSEQLDDRMQDAIGQLSNEQKQKFYYSLLTSAPNLKMVTNSIDLMSKCSADALGDLLYDKKFLSIIIKDEICLDYFWENNILNENIEKIDLQRILNDDDLFKFYSKSTSLFWNEIDVNLTQNQLETLCNDKHFWALSHTSFDFDLNFVEKLIGKSPEKFNQIFHYLPEKLKKDPKIELSLLLLGHIELVDDLKLKNENLFRFFESKPEAYGVIDAKTLGIDEKLYSVLSACARVDGVKPIKSSKNISDYYNEYTDDERKNLFLSLPDMFINHSELNSQLGDKIKKIYYSRGRNIDKAKKLLFLTNEVFENRISNDEIETFINTHSKSILKIVEDLYDFDGFIALNNLYHSMCNKTTDLFLELIESGFQKTIMYYVSPELVNELGQDVVKNVIIFPETYYYLLTLQKEGKLGLYKKLITSSQNIAMDKLELYNKLVFSCVAFPNLIEKMVKNNTLNQEGIIELINLSQMLTFQKIDELNSTKEYYDNLPSFCDNGVQHVNDILLLKDLFCQRFLKTSYTSASELYNSFKKSISSIKSEKHTRIFKIIENIINCEDIEQLKQMYSNLKKENFIVDKNIYQLTADLKEEVIGKMMPYNYEKKSDVIDYTGKEFEMAVHVVAAYGSTIESNSIYNSWNSKERFNNTGICISVINSNYFGHAFTDKSSVIFGFNNINPNEIQLMGPYDLYSDTSLIQTFSGRKLEYFNSEELVNNTRTEYNEVVINRYLSNGEKRQPDFILCFDKINAESKKASKQFGIPIMFVDVKKHIDKKIEEIENLKQDFVSSQSTELLNKIICMQETLKLGLAANNENIADKYFNENYATNNILFLIENCKSKQVIEYLETIMNREINRNNAYDTRDYEFNVEVNAIMDALNRRKDTILTEKFEIIRSRQQTKDVLINNQNSIIEEEQIGRRMV